MMRILFAVALAAMAFTGSAGAAPQGYVAVGAEWAADWSSKNLDAVMALYAPNPEFMPETHESWIGMAAIRKNFTGALTQYSADLHLHSARSFASGNLACDSGTYDETMSPVKGGKAIRARGNYLFVFQRQKNGEWKILEQTWTLFGPGKL